MTTRETWRRAMLIFIPAIASLAAVSPIAAHEQRDVAGYAFVVGFRSEPVFVGEESGLEFTVHDAADQPVTGLDETLQAEVTYQGQTRALELSPQFGEDGAYRSIFFPTAAGSYTFRVFGTIGDVDLDESFTSGPDTFGDVQEAQAGQFPNQLPSTAELATDARRGAVAADQVMLALALGVAGVVIGLVAVGLALAARRRRS